MGIGHRMSDDRERLLGNVAGIRVLHVIDTLSPDRGGPVECISQIGRGLTASGITVEVVCFDTPDKPWLARFPLRTYAIGPSYLRYAYCPGFLAWLNENGSRYDYFVVNGLWQYYGLATWLYCRANAKKYYVYAHGHLDPWTKRRYPAKYAKKWIYWHLFERNIARRAEGVIFTSEEESVLAREYFNALHARPVVVGNGIAPPAGDPAAQRSAFFAAHPELQGKRIVLFIG